MRRKNTESSGYDVGQSRAQPDTFNKTVKVSARLTPAVANTKPPYESWSNFIARLVRRGMKKNLYGVELTRHVVWATVALDRIALESRSLANDAPDEPVADRVSRLAKWTQILAEVGMIRRDLENILEGTLDE